MQQISVNGVYTFSQLIMHAVCLLFSFYREDAHNPKFWSRVCVHNMAKLAKEATTVRRVLESMYRYFDSGNLWSPQHGLALAVLLDMQLVMETSGIFFSIFNYHTIYFL